MVVSRDPKPAQRPHGPSISHTKMSGKAKKEWGVPGNNTNGAGLGPALPPQTGKPWPGGGRVPPPDEGNQDAIRTSLRVPAGAKVMRVSPLTNVHAHNSVRT